MMLQVNGKLRGQIAWRRRRRAEASETLRWRERRRRKLCKDTAEKSGGGVPELVISSQEPSTVLAPGLRARRGLAAFSCVVCRPPFASLYVRHAGSVVAQRIVPC